MEKHVKLLPPAAFQSTLSDTGNGTANVNSPSSLYNGAVTQFPTQVRHSSIHKQATFLSQPKVSENYQVRCGSHEPPHVTGFQVESLASKSNSREAQLSAQLHVLEEQLQSRSNAYKAHIEKLEVEMRTILEQQQQASNEHSKQIKDYETQLSEKSGQLEQLKCYITENSTPSTQICKKEIDNLKNKIQDLEKEKRGLENSLELLNIRLKSHDQIQNIHDSEISEAGEIHQDKKKQILLKRWRTKVYELLVQLQSQDLIQKKERQVHKQMVCDLESARESLNQQVAVLQHALDDKQATLDMQLQYNKKLENELQSAENLAIELDNKNKGYQHTIGSLVDFANRMFESFLEKEEKHNKMSHTLQLYNQRITFASGRVEMLQSQFARKDALLRMELQKEREAQKDDKDCANENSSSLCEDLQQEIERLARERDSLARQSKQDVLTLEQKLKEARQENDRQISVLQEQNRELQDKIQLQTAELASAMESLEVSEREKNELQQTIDQLKTRAEEMQNNIQQEIEKAYECEQQNHRKEVAELQQKLSDSGREHSKTVVSLRQLERQMSRERERLNEQIKSTEDYYKQIVVKLENNVKELEKERNLLMTTLRQEGLVGKHRAARSSPVTWQTDHGPSDVTIEQTSFDKTDQEKETDVTVDQSSDVILQTEHSEFHLTGEEQGQSYAMQAKDTYFEEIPGTQGQDVELADVIEEVKKLSEEIIDDSSSLDSVCDDVTQHKE